MTGQRAPARRDVPTLLLGDIHLVHHTPREVAGDVARFVAAHAGARIVVAGDLFDLSASNDRLPRPARVARAFAAHPDVRAALGAHLDGGGELWLAPGNHDVEVGSPSFRETLLDELRPRAEARARLRTTPWFFREGALHVEHGHLYDPDNAPTHPLVVGEPSLGVHLVETFIGPADAYRYINANDETPLTLLTSAFAWYGTRAPDVIICYFRSAFGALARSGPFRRGEQEERALGGQRLGAFADEAGLDVERVAALAELGAEPTFASLGATFGRLYFDRVAATLALAAGAGALAIGARRAGAALAGIGAAGLAASWAAGHNRYRGNVADRLAAVAARVADASDAKLVVFGHTHCEALDERYANTGSFAFPGRAPGRPFLVLDDLERPRPVRRYWPRTVP